MAEPSLIHASENGDRWHLVREPGADRASVRHEANPASGGHVTVTEVEAFLGAGRSGPEHAALRRVLGEPGGAGGQARRARDGGAMAGGPSGAAAFGGEVAAAAGADGGGGAMRDEDLAGIERVAWLYMEGMHACDPGRLNAAFHPTARVQGYRGAEWRSLTREQFVAYASSPTPPGSGRAGRRASPSTCASSRSTAPAVRRW
jgi:Putative lumazine-binding